MAFTAAGLGGSFASGIMQGEQSAQQRREGIQREKEKDYLGMYSKLVQSGDWEPVDSTKGVKDGGVLRIGNVGFLQQRQGGGQSSKDVMQLAHAKLYETQAEQAKLGPKPTLTTINEPGRIKGPKGDEVEVMGEQKAWVRSDGSIVSRVGSWKAKLDPPRGLVQWINLSTGEKKQIPPGEHGGPGFELDSKYPTTEGLALRQNVAKTGALEDKEKRASKIVDSNISYLDLGPQKEGSVMWNKQQAALSAIEESVSASAEKQALINGDTPPRAKMVGELAGKYARAKYEKKIAVSEVPKEVRESGLKEFSGMGSNLLQNYPVPNEVQRSKRYPISKKKLLQK